ncbi:hypothetical protein Q6280_28585, partial [Klebsiella pneumoniae]|uniref:hypothetical protein n=1 Tax=Klebsiella pneumoniae TaxID=573 RepID=UPI00272FFEBF
SSKQLWEELSERYNQSNAPLLYQLRKAVVHTVQGDDPVIDYYAKLKTIWEDLRSLDEIPDCECGAFNTCT